MSRVPLNWRNVTPSNNPKFFVKGTELNVALCGPCSRYQICEVRSYGASYDDPDRVYLVRDAHTVNDAQIREGIRPKIVARFVTLDEAENYCWNNA